MNDAPTLTTPAPALPPEPPLHQPIPLVYVFGLLPSVLLNEGWVASLLWCAVTTAAMRQTFPPTWQRHVAGALAALGGSLALLFFAGWDLRPLAVLLFLPAFVVGALAMRSPRLLVTLARSPIAAVLLYAGSVFGLYFAGSTAGPLPPAHDDFLYGLRAVPTPDPLTEEERLAAIRVVQAAIGGRPVDVATLPGALLEATSGRVWVTLFRPGRRARRTRGMAPAGDVLHEQLTAATQQAMKEAPTRGAWLAQQERITIIVDLAGPSETIKPRLPRRAFAGLIDLFATSDRHRFDLLVYEAEPGIDGFLLEGEDGQVGVALPADHLLSGWVTPRSRKRRYRMHNFDALHKRLLKRAGLPRETPVASLPMQRFRTYSFGLPDPAVPRTVELYRGNVLLPDEPTEELLLERIDLAGQWLLSTVEESGRFDYEYFPNKDDHGRGYNEVRHAGSVYGLFHMSRLARAEPTLAHTADDYLRAGISTLDRVYDNLGTPAGASPEDGYVAFLEGENTNSGAAALTLLSFIERPRPEEIEDPELKALLWNEGDEAAIDGLANTLVKMIDDEGKVYERWDEAWAGGGVIHEPVYYPGEAMFALALYYERTGEEKWLEAARAIGRRQIPYSRSLWVIPDHWVMQALDVLDRVDPEPTDEWRKGAYAMGARYVQEQFHSPGFRMNPGPAQRPPFPDYRGAYRRVQEVPRTTRAASRGEAIGGVARIAWRHGDPSEHWERSLIEGARHLMEQQYVPDNSFFLPDPDEVQGAIRMGIVDMHIRIDNNQHGVVALGAALAAMREQAGR